MRQRVNCNNEIVILDYKLGNLFSVEHACLKVGLDPIITSDKEVLSTAKAIILPGVGAFEDAMNNLISLDLKSPLLDMVSKGIPLIGVCLGLHLLFEESEENGIHKGLGLVEGVVKKLPKSINGEIVKVPNVGWSKIYSHVDNGWNKTLLNNVDRSSFMYFVHSYYAEPINNREVLTVSNYEGFEFCSGIKKENISAFQFHPEKSGLEGLKIYQSIKNSYYGEE